ncbi:MAG: Transcriptional regulatory protein BtsR [Saprospiraceae bacterium]|nr:Transcriptional regulatory protein BtsR [Saprospiraceae bacterium]
MTALIIDDEAGARDALAELVQLYCPGLKLVGTAVNGETGIELIRQKHPGIVFLDVEMPGMDGFEVLRRLGKTDFALIFVTAYNRHAVRAFEFSAVDFLLKPVEASRLIQAVHRASERHHEQNTLEQYQLLLELINQQGHSVALDHRIVFSMQNEIVFSWLRNLIWIDADTNMCYVKIADYDKPLHIARTIGDYEKQFEGYDNLMRVHRSNIINLLHVKKFLREDSVLVMTDGLKVPVAANKREEVLKRLREH